TGDPAGSNLEPAMGAFAGIADVIAPAIRDVDLIGECDERTLGILCLDADECAAERCVERLVDAIVCGRFIDPAAFAIGAAVCPIHASDMRGLVTHAASHPSVTERAHPSWRARF